MLSDGKEIPRKRPDMWRNRSSVRAQPLFGVTSSQVKLWEDLRPWTIQKNSKSTRLLW